MRARKSNEKIKGFEEVCYDDLEKQYIYISYDSGNAILSKTCGKESLKGNGNGFLEFDFDSGIVTLSNPARNIAHLSEIFEKVFACKYDDQNEQF